MYSYRQNSCVRTCDESMKHFSYEMLQSNKSLSKTGTAGIYGMMAAIPDKAIINDFITEFFSEVYTLK